MLRLLGEVSTLRNQLAQMNEYLAGIERETARVQKEEQTSAAELERLAAARHALSETMAQRQLELESVAGERQRTEAGSERAAPERRRSARPHRPVAHRMFAS